MSKIQLSYLFDTAEELRAHLALGETRAVEQADALARLTITADAHVEDTGTAADRSAVDADGMPYDAAVHSDPPKFTSKNLWQSRKGKATEAEAARAAWKARGGNIAPPVADDTRRQTIAAPVAAPLAAPVAAPLAAPVAAPVTIERVYAATEAAQKRGVSNDRLVGVYALIGLTELSQFDTNESLRAAYVSHVDAL